MYLASLAVIANSGTLTERLSALHTRLLETVPIVDRIACALYEAKDDKLKTFINSTRSGHAISAADAQQASAVFDDLRQCVAALPASPDAPPVDAPDGGV